MGVGCRPKGTPLPFRCSVRFPLNPLEFNDLTAESTQPPRTKRRVQGTFLQVTPPHARPAPAPPPNPPLAADTSEFSGSFSPDPPKGRTLSISG